MPVFCIDDSIRAQACLARRQLNPTKALAVLTDDLSRTYLTTHQVARMVGASPSTVLSWVDRGWLPAHRTPGGHRRIERHALVEFLRAHDMPEMAPESEPVRLLLAIRPNDYAIELAQLLRTRHSDWRVDVTEGVVGTLAQLFESPPDALVLDATLNGIDTCVLCRELTACAVSARVRLVIVRPPMMSSIDSSLRECGVWAILESPTSPQAIAECLSLGTVGLANAG